MSGTQHLVLCFLFFIPYVTSMALTNLVAGVLGHASGNMSSGSRVVMSLGLYRMEGDIQNSGSILL